MKSYVFFTAQNKKQIDDLSKCIHRISPKNVLDTLLYLVKNPLIGDVIIDIETLPIALSKQIIEKIHSGVLEY